MLPYYLLKHEDVHIITVICPFLIGIFHQKVFTCNSYILNEIYNVNICKLLQHFDWTIFEGAKIFLD